jgi:glucose dehydrogenase
MDILTSVLIRLTNGIPGLVVAGVAMILMLLALIRKESGLMVFAAVLFVPFAFAMGTWTDLRLFVRLMPLFLLGSAFAISKDETLLAWVLPIPAAAYLVYVLFNIIVSDF